MVGISFFVIISSVFDIIFIPKYMRELFSQLSRYSFVAFLVHHQILLLFYSAFDVTHSNNFVKFSVLITVITLSFFYGYVVYPLVNDINRKTETIYSFIEIKNYMDKAFKYDVIVCTFNGASFISSQLGKYFIANHFAAKNYCV